VQGSLLFFVKIFFLCGKYFFYDVWGELARSHLPSHSCHA
jgi:hypothetical protein